MTQEALSQRRHRRPAMIDILGGGAWAAVVTALTAWLEHIGPIEAGTRPVDALGYVLVAVAGAALAWRNVADISTFAVVLVLGIAYQTVGYPTDAGSSHSAWGSWPLLCWSGHAACPSTMG